MLPDARVGGGVTAPRGGLGGVAPVAWIRGMAAAHAKLDAYAHHPYPSSPAETPSSGGCRNCPSITMATIPKLLILVRRSLRAEAGLAHRVRLPDESAGHVPRRSAPEAGDAAQPCGDARVEAATGHDADPVPLPRRGRARPLPERARLRGQPVEALSAGIQVAVRGNAASRVPDNGLGPDPRRAARAEAVPAGGAPHGTSGRQSGATG